MDCLALFFCFLISFCYLFYNYNFVVIFFLYFPHSLCNIFCFEFVVCVCVCVYIYVYVCDWVCVCVYVYVCAERERMLTVFVDQVVCANSFDTSVYL